jgi:hypothetical protein
MNSNLVSLRNKIQLLQIVFIGIFLISFLVPCYEGSSLCCGNSVTNLGYKCFITSFALAILAFKNQAVLSVLYFMSGIWIPIILLIRKRKNALLYISILAFISISIYWITINFDHFSSSSLLAGYWIWYFSNIGIITCQLIKVFKTTLPLKD